MSIQKNMQNEFNKIEIDEKQLKELISTLVTITVGKSSILSYESQSLVYLMASLFDNNDVKAQFINNINNLSFLTTNILKELDALKNQVSKLGN